MRGSRRGYFFIIDAIIASTVLFAGLFVIFSGGFTTPDSLQPTLALEGLVTSIGITPLSETVDPYYLSDLLPNGLVLYPDATPLEEIVYLRQKDCGSVNCTDHARNYTRSLFETTIGPQYGAELRLDDEIVYTHGQAPRSYLIARPVIVYARNETTVIGPVIAEVRLWG